MGTRRFVSWLSRGWFVFLTLAVGSGITSAHEVGGSRFDAPLPLTLLFVGAGATVALTALWLALSDRTTPRERRRRVLTIPPPVVRLVRYAVSGVFLAGVVTALTSGLVGRQVAAENFATVFTWPVWFRGVALFAIVFGNPWETLSPWRTIYSGLVRLEGRAISLFGEDDSVFEEWPAVIGFVVLIGVIENLTVVPASPRLTAVVLAAYGLAMVVGSVLFGGMWLRRGDPLGVFYRLFARVSVFDVSKTDDGELAVVIQPPWRGILTPVRSVPLVVFVVATVYTVSFDGFTNTRLFQTVLFAIRDALGTGPGTSALLYGLGLVTFVTTFVAGIGVVERLGSESVTEWLTATYAFAPTLLPIAAAYEVAHNYPYVIRNLGQLAVVSVQWTMSGVESIDLLGWLSLPLFWGSQVLLIVLGHVVAVVAAHYVAVERYDSLSSARRAHVPLVVLMVAYTVLSLWIISQPVVSG